MNNFLEAELQLEINALRREIDLLKKENEQLKKVVIENDLESELNITKNISPEEQICLDGIRYLAEVFRTGTFDKNDALNFDILHKNLRMIRGQSTGDKTKKSKPADINELLKIVEGGKGG
jgi:hypothetical protein